MTTLVPRKQRAEASASEQGALIKLVVFPVGKLTLALPMSSISRVVNMPQVDGSGLSPVGLTTLGNMQLTIVDLHRQLFHCPAPSQAQQRVNQTVGETTPPKGYLVILPVPGGEPIGIPTITTPALVDVPETEIRALPATYRQADTLAIASHITRITSETGEIQSVFLLDVAAVIAMLNS